jgi:two-component system chemotaxis sensor kinase CheA
MMVDSINDTEEIVVKPLGKLLKGVSGFVGATILGDGRVALILDIAALGQKAAGGSERRAKAAAETADTKTAASQGDHMVLLLFQVGGRRLGIPLSAVTRLEEFPRAKVERAGDREVVQYRGRLLPLVHLASVLGAEPADETVDPIQVVVYTHQGLDVGIVVDNIMDIVEEELSIHRRPNQDITIGTAVVQGKVTDLLDVRSIVEREGSVLLEQAEAGVTAALWG